MRILFFISFLLLAFTAFSGEINLSGKYSGKDLFIRNPFEPRNNTFCVKEVWLNDEKIMENPQASAINVRMNHLPLGARVNIKIIHGEFCTPQVINEEVLHTATQFRFIYTGATYNSIDWRTVGEKIAGRFTLEQEMTNPDESTFWEEIAESNAKGKLGENMYSVNPRHFAGDNKYRIRYDPLEGKRRYSAIIIFTSPEELIYVIDNVVTIYLEFSNFTDYEIYDSSQRLILKGGGKDALVEDLRPGEYFVKIQNRFERFVKK